MTNDHDTAQMHDWNKLAQEALDLWEGHLNALAADPHAKAEMAKFISPMSQMFANWTTMMQSGLEGMGLSGAADRATSPDISSAPDAEEEEPYNVWMEEMLRASSASSRPFGPVVGEAAAPSASTSAKASYDKADSMVDVSDSHTPAYAANTGASFTLVQEAVPEDYQSLIHTGLESVAAASANESTVADSRIDASVAQPVASSVVDTGTNVTATAQSRDAASSAGSRDLAELASRLAQLERELDGMRAKGRGELGAASADDELDDPVARRMAEARQG
ncbi:MAG: hypothetical protein AB7E52_07310 [Bdellovibrionales bacterium]